MVVLCKHHHSQGKENFITPNNPLMRSLPCPVTPLNAHPQLLVTIGLNIAIVLSFPESHLHEIVLKGDMQTLILLSIVSLRFIQVVGCVTSSFYSCPVFHYMGIARLVCPFTVGKQIISSSMCLIIELL